MLVIGNSHCLVQVMSFSRYQAIIIFLVSLLGKKSVTFAVLITVTNDGSFAGAACKKQCPAHNQHWIKSRVEIHCFSTSGILSPDAIGYT
jgi:hypothetical protein